MPVMNPWFPPGRVEKSGREPVKDTRKRSRPGRRNNTYSEKYVRHLESARRELLSAHFAAGGVRSQQRIGHALQAVDRELLPARAQVTERAARRDHIKHYVPPQAEVDYELIDDELVKVVRHD